jgi:glycine/D-amino acid oxidase-like deaminating enzyme
MVGGKLLPNHPILMPLAKTSFWYISAPTFKVPKVQELPTTADVVIIGCGLTGASAFYHLRNKGLRVLLLDESSIPCAQSSGKNGGNFQLLAESYIGAYDGVVGERLDIIKTHFPHMKSSCHAHHAKRDAKLMLKFTMRNAARFTEIVKAEAIECDYSPGGWLQIASNEQEAKAMELDMQLLPDEMKLMDPLDMIEKWKLSWTPPHRGRWIFRSGNYHPVKFVHGLLTASMNNNMQISLNTKVTGVTGGNVYTNKGVIRAKKIIVATNAFTPFVLPKFKGIVTCIPSQILNLEHVKQNLEGATITEQYGEVYYNFPKSTVRHHYGMLHYGMDHPNEIDNPYDISRSPVVFHKMLEKIHERFPDTKGQPASRCWAGPLAMTSDRTPIIGPLPEDNIIMAVAFNGFGGSWCVQAGYTAAGIASGDLIMSKHEQQVFSPQRFFCKPHEWRK